MLFVFTIGLQLGPGFAAALRNQGVKLNLLAATIVILGAISAPLIGALAGFDMAAVLGIYSGAVTNTPSLGAGSQTLSTLPNITPDRLALPALGYAVAYPMAIVGIIGTLILLKQLFRIDPVREAAAFAEKNRAPVDPLERRTLVVTNPNLHGVRVDAIPGRIEARITISRVCSGDGTVAATDATVIHLDDRLAVVGTRAGLEQFERVVGRRSDEDLLLQESDITYRRVVVTDRDTLGKTVAELNLDDRFGVAVTRVTRADLEMTAVPGLRLQFGDQLQIVGRDRRPRQSRDRGRQFAQGIKRDAFHSLLHRHRARDRTRQHADRLSRFAATNSSRFGRWSARRGAHPRPHRAHRPAGMEHADQYQSRLPRIRDRTLLCRRRPRRGREIFRYRLQCHRVLLATRRILRHRFADPAHRHLRALRLENKFHGPERLHRGQYDRSSCPGLRLQHRPLRCSDGWLRHRLSAYHALAHPLGAGARDFPFPMNTPTLGEARFASSKSHTTSDDIRIPERIEVGADSGLQFELAGPRAKLFFDPKQTRAGIVTCGGLCPGLNNVIRSLFLELHYGYGVAEVLGFRGGYTGLDPKCGVEPVKLTPAFVDGIHQHGGTVLGSSRGPVDIGRAVDNLIARDVNILFTVGGDGTQRGAHDLYQEARKRGHALSVVGVPKTIDNDVGFVSRTFGFFSAVEEAKRVLDCAHTEARSVPGGIGLVKLMGRHAGFVTAGAVIASQDVNFALIPEVPFKLESFLAALKERMVNKSHAVIAVAEGAGQDLLGADAD